MKIEVKTKTKQTQINYNVNENKSKDYFFLHLFVCLFAFSTSSLVCIPLLLLNWTFSSRFKVIRLKVWAIWSNFHLLLLLFNHWIWNNLIAFIRTSHLQINSIHTIINALHRWTWLIKTRNKKIELIEFATEFDRKLIVMCHWVSDWIKKKRRKKSK